MINLTIDEREAIESLDVEVLRRAIDQARQGPNSAALTQLQLHRLGSFVQSAERRFTNALDDLRKAKAAANISKKEQAAVRAGWDLISSVDQMKERAEQERRDGVRFYIDDHIREPYAMRPEMDVTVSFRWRSDENDSWRYGRIMFYHRYADKLQFDHKHRRTASRRERDLSDSLWREWSYLRDLALFSVRDFFRNGGDGKDIPEKFEAVTDQAGLNNFSLKFWD